MVNETHPKYHLRHSKFEPCTHALYHYYSFSGPFTCRSCGAVFPKLSDLVRDRIEAFQVWLAQIIEEEQQETNDGR